MLLRGLLKFSDCKLKSCSSDPISDSVLFFQSTVFSLRGSRRGLGGKKVL